MPKKGDLEYYGGLANKDFKPGTIIADWRVCRRWVYNLT